MEETGIQEDFVTQKTMCQSRFKAWHIVLIVLLISTVVCVVVAAVLINQNQKSKAEENRQIDEKGSKNIFVI